VIGSKDSDEYSDQYFDFKNISFHFNVDANKMVDLMKNCDLAITTAGQTIYELLATQTPFIPIQIIKNQENNIRSLLKYNQNQIILKYDNDNLVEEISKLLDFYNESENRQEQINHYKCLVDGYGTKRIIDILLGDMKVVK
jgi:spore coat polysaccharide biosynthesis predicted glycosyltransferase SpsG